MTSPLASRVAFTVVGAFLLLGVAAVPSGYGSATHEPASAMRAMWKPQTHVFAANIALNDALDGTVRIPPYGEFPVSATARRALKAAPASYRAGVLAPDLFPDMYVGGFFIHSDLETTPDKWIADDWMRHLWRKAWQYNGDPAQRDKVMAFAYGFLTHAAGDMFAHTYVNQKADGAWNNPNISTVKKHLVLEGYVGLRTPDTDLSLDVWPRFVANSLIHDAAARRHISAPHYRTFTRIHDWLGPQMEKAKAEMNANMRDDATWAEKCAAHMKACAKFEQMETWRADIESGFRALVDANQTLGEKIMEGKTREGIDAITGWSIEWVPKMFGAHAVGEGAAAMQELLDWIGDPLAPISKAIRDEVESFVKQEFAEYYAMYDVLDNPSYWMDNAGFPPGTKEIVNQDMHVRAGPDSLLSWTSFEPLYNTVILSKLALLDGDGLNALAAKAGVSDQLFAPGESTNIMLGVFRSMTLSYQWMGEIVKADTGSARTKYGVCGPEDGSVLPKEALCGITQRSYKTPPPPRTADMSLESTRTGGFAFWGHPEAREKIFRVIFKGYGPGPGLQLADEVLTAPAGGTRVDTRGVRAAVEQVERMREVVARMRGKIGGTMAPTGSPTAAGARLPASIRRPGRAPAPTATAVPAQQGEPITDWGQRCCAKDIAELRAAVSALGRSNAALQNPALGVRLARPGAGQLGGEVAALSAAINAFANTRDSRSAAAALANVSNGVERVARLLGVGST